MIGMPSAHEGREVDRTTVQVHRHDRPSAARDGIGGVLRVDGSRRSVDVDQHRRRAEGTHRGGGRHRGERRDDHLVAGRHADGPQRQLQPRCAARNAHRVPVSEQQRQLVLAGLELGAHQQVAGAEHPLDGIEEHEGLRSVTSGQVDDGDHACSR